MKYQLVDLGRPKNKKYCTAFIVAPTGSFIVKGCHWLIQDHIKENFWNKNIPFFGMLKTYMNGKCTDSRPLPLQYIVGVTQIKEKKRTYFQLTYQGVKWTKRMRRLPTKWPKEIPTDLNTEIMIAADYLEERGFVNVAKYLRAKHGI